MHDHETFQHRSWISPSLKKQILLLHYVRLSFIYSLSPSRFADYSCINHHDTGKATQFSAAVGKVSGVPRQWHEA